MYKGVEPLTPDDIAEVVVFAAGRRENVVIADTLIFPNHQVSRQSPPFPSFRREQMFCPFSPSVNVFKRLSFFFFFGVDLELTCSSFLHILGFGNSHASKIVMVFLTLPLKTTRPWLGLVELEDSSFHPQPLKRGLFAEVVYSSRAPELESGRAVRPMLDIFSSRLVSSGLVWSGLVWQTHTYTHTYIWEASRLC